MILGYLCFGQASELDALNASARSFIHKNLDSVDFYLDKIFNQIDSVEFPSQYAEAHNIVSIKLMQQGQFDSSLYHLQKNISRYEKLGDEKGLAGTNGNIGNIFRIRGDNLSAIKYLLIALAYFEKSDFKEAVGGTMLNIGIIYGRLERYQDAISYYKSALEVFEELDNIRLIASCQISLGNAYKDLGDFNAAINYQRKALKNSRLSGNVIGIADSYGNLGQIYLIKEEYDSSVKNMRRAVDQLFLLKDSVKLSVAHSTLASALYGNGNVPEALDNAEIAQEIAYHKDFTLSKEKISELLMNIYSELGDHKKAYEQAVIHLEARDSLYNNEKSAAIARIEAQYEFEKKEERLKAEQLAKELELEKQNQRNLIASISGTVIVVLVALFIYFQYRQRSKYAKTVEEKNQLLSETMASKEKLFSVIAHDLKSPLSAFSSMSSTLAENIDAFQKEQIAVVLKKFEKSSQNLTELLNNLLQWSLSQTGSLTVSPETLNIRQSMENAIKPLTDLAESKEINLHVEGDTSKVLADPKMVETVIRNLVSNALKFTDHGGEVSITSKEEGKNILISVTDNGVGMDQEELALLFNVKHDPSGIGDHEEKGTGLGLILSKELIEKNNGTIGATSTKDKGSTFYFTLPSAA